MSIKKPSAVESPYVTTSTTPTVLNSAPGVQKAVQTASQVAADQATIDATVAVPNRSYYANGQTAIDSLITTSRTGVFAGANVTLQVTEEKYITYNQNFTGNGTVGGSNGQIQFNNNGEFAGSTNLTFDGANLAVGGTINGSQVSTTGSVTGGNILTGGLVSATGNVTGNYILGNGSQLTGISAGSSNKIFNGNSYANIASAGGSLVIGINGGNAWTFDSNSTLTAPGGSQWQNQANADAYFTSSIDGYVHLQSFYADSNVASEVFLEHGLVQIIAHSLGANTDYTWTFNDDANLGLPAGSNISDTAGTLVIEANAGSSLTVKATNGNAYTRFEAGADYAQIGLQDDTTGAYQAWAYLETDMANVNTPSAVVILKPGDTGTEVRWTYNANGSLTPPTQASNQRTGSGLTLKIGDENTQAIITGPAPIANSYNTAPRLVIAGQDGVIDGEGGDIYLWAGYSGPAGGSGGDIKVDAGNAYSGSDGGTVKIRGGRSIDADLNGTGGFVEIDGGRGDFGGPVTITGGLGNSQANSANVRIITEYGGTWTFDSYANLTLPNGALLKDTAGDSVAFGQNAGANSQQQHSVAIGPGAGNINQGEDSVAIGWDAGGNNQTSMGIAIGWNAGNDNQGQHAQAYGFSAGAYYQKYGAIALGQSASRYLQGQSAIAIGSFAGSGGPQGATVASMLSPDVVRVFGSTSTLYNGMTVVGGSIAPTTGITIVGLSGEDITLSSVPATPLTNGTSLNFYPAQSTGAVAVGEYSAQTLQGQNAVAVGYRAGQTRQGNSSVSIGEDAGYITQAANSVAIGSAAGFDNQGTKAISIGLNAGRTTQGNAAIAMGWTAGQSNQGIAAVSIGEDAGYTTQGNAAVALGLQAGYDTQGANAVAIGYTAGLSAQGNVAIAIGMDAGQSNQGTAAIAMGWGAGQGGQGNAAIAIGEDAGFTNQGEYSVAIGYQAGYYGQANNSIVLNASGDQINGITANSFTVKPIRNASTGNVLYYDQSSGEITFDVGGSGGLPVANGTSNFDIATANGNATITANSGNTWTFDTAGNLTVPGNIIGSGNILIAPDSASASSYLDIYLTGGPDIHIAGNDNSIVIGRDTGANVFVGNDGEVSIRTDNGATAQVWNFTDTGNTTFPNGAIFTGYDLYAAANSYIELAGDTGNTYMGVSNTSAFIQTDWGNAQYQWTFDANGNLSVPGAISAVGNITGGNILTAGNIINSGSGGDITLTSGNITGAVNISATGNITASNFFGNGNTLSNVATTFESTWTVPTGNSTQSFTVAASNTYLMWVDCNIANGIIAWNATATVTNTNVPVVGAQYAWVYSGGGTPIDFTSIPNQFVGTSNTIVRSSTAPSATTNRFDFGINNTSGGNVTVRYGWAQIS